MSTVYNSATYGTNIFSDVQCSDKNLMQYIILEHELKLSEVHIARSLFWSA